MVSVDRHPSTGLAGLDGVLKGVLPGDNIVFQADSVREYEQFVKPYLATAIKKGKDVIYFRFARHEPLAEHGNGVTVYPLEPEKGFEAFVKEVHGVIHRHGRGAYYVFDCLSDLALAWYSDEMLGNFFMLTCPYLLDMEAVAYFHLYRNFHAAGAATEPIKTTAQVFLDVYRHEGEMFIHPIKVQHRYSSTMYMLHHWKGERFEPVSQSATISEVLTSVPWFRHGGSGGELGIWNRSFMEAEEILETARLEDEFPEETQELKKRLIRMAISRDERVAAMIDQYMTLEDIYAIGKRVIGTGLIGGKSVGMLLSRAILEKTDSHWRTVLEPHDAFYIGADVFYTFLWTNGIWWERQRQSEREDFLEGSARARQRMLMGTFPEGMDRQISDLMDYFGQSPFIVRSSSLLEDNFGNAFAGKYESVFCVNQGPRDKRLEDFKTAIKTIYASAMSEKALTYRAQRGLLDQDEQMALLVQRVSGSFYDRLFMPLIAGVGFSFNPYVWSEESDPKAGVLRLVCGLGTRAVDAREDDYTRVVALNAPLKRPESNRQEVRQYTQRSLDGLDLEANQLSSYDFPDAVQQAPSVPLSLIARKDAELEELSRQSGRDDVFPWVIDFTNLFTRTDFIKDMRSMLSLLQRAYDYPVDMEFTCNFFPDDGYRINVVQCRPLQVKGGGDVPDPPSDLNPGDIAAQSHGAIIGQSRCCAVDRLVYVVPKVYGELPIKDRYRVARLIGELMHVPEFYEGKTIMLLGPGRWGTSSPELGVPISFSEINTVSVLCEVVEMRDDLVPDVSLGTHLFSELVEMDILYMALFPHQEGNFLNREFFESEYNMLTRYLPQAGEWEPGLRVVEKKEGTLKLNANAWKQKAVCYLEPSIEQAAQGKRRV